MDQVTVVVPFYNVETYIGDCLESLLRQTHKSIEILCVDDCSQDNSLQKVAPICEATYNLLNIESLPSNYFDVVICHNVVQHVPTELLKAELSQVMRSMKKDGIFAVEFVSNKDFDDNGIEPTETDIQRGTLCRSPQYFEEMLNHLGGVCFLYYDVETNFRRIHGCHVFHVRHYNC